jgi:four helix bundle protein
MSYSQISSFRDLEVYQRLFALALRVSALTLEFPKFETYELGSQMRRASNSAPANLAEGWNNKHIRMYLEGINRAQAEIREMQHHLAIAGNKAYLTQEALAEFDQEYVRCAKMLRALEQSLLRIHPEVR